MMDEAKLALRKYCIESAIKFVDSSPWAFTSNNELKEGDKLSQMKEASDRLIYCAEKMYVFLTKESNHGA